MPTILKKEIHLPINDVHISNRGIAGDKECPQDILENPLEVFSHSGGMRTLSMRDTSDILSGIKDALHKATGVDLETTWRVNLQHITHRDHIRLGSIEKFYNNGDVDTGEWFDWLATTGLSVADRDGNYALTGISPAPMCHMPEALEVKGFSKAFRDIVSLGEKLCVSEIIFERAASSVQGLPVFEKRDEKYTRRVSSIVDLFDRIKDGGDVEIGIDSATGIGVLLFVSVSKRGSTAAGSSFRVASSMFSGDSISYHYLKNSGLGTAIDTGLAFYVK